MAFACILAVAFWHYGGRGYLGWVYSLATVALAYLGMSRVFNTRKRFAPRTYRYAE
jgi:hypothetical protein